MLVPYLQSERFGKHFASFGREAAMLADLNHPNVLRFYGVVTEGVNDNTVIGIMTEYIRGGSLSSFLRWVPGAHVTQSARNSVYRCMLLSHSG